MPNPAAHLLEVQLHPAGLPTLLAVPVPRLGALVHPVPRAVRLRHKIGPLTHHLNQQVHSGSLPGRLHPWNHLSHEKRLSEGFGLPQGAAAQVAQRIYWEVIGVVGGYTQYNSGDCQCAVGKGDAQDI